MSGGVIQPDERGMSERVNSSRRGVESVTCDWSDEVKEAFLDESECGVCVSVCISICVYIHRAVAMHERVIRFVYLMRAMRAT